MAQCPDFSLWHYIKESELRTTKSPRCPHTRTKPMAEAVCDSCFPPANRHMFEPRFLIHELVLILQPSTALCYCWSSACSRAGAGVFLKPLSGISFFDFLPRLAFSSSIEVEGNL